MVLAKIFMSQMKIYNPTFLSHTTLLLGLKRFFQSQSPLGADGGNQSLLEKLRNPHDTETESSKDSKDKRKGQSKTGCQTD